MHEKAPTAGNLEAKGWDNNVVCPLCLLEAETNIHLLIACNYTQEVLQFVKQWMPDADPLQLTQTMTANITP